MINFLLNEKFFNTFVLESMFFHQQIFDSITSFQASTQFKKIKLWSEKIISLSAYHIIAFIMMIMNVDCVKM